MITLKQIEAVHWVQKLGSFHAAAERLNVTQSTISKRVQELEQWLGFPIFDRTNRTSQVTLKGRALLNDFTEMLNLYHKIEQRSKDDFAYSGTFHLGATEMVALTWLPALIRAITTSFPYITLKTSVGLTHEIQQELVAYKLDLILCPIVRGEFLQGFQSRELRALESAWMCSADMAMDRQKVLSAREVADLPLLTYSEGSLHHQTVVKSLSEQGFPARQSITCSSMITIAELVRGGLGISYLPREYFHHPDAGLAILNTDLPMRPLQYAAVYRDDFIAARIADIAHQHCNFGRPRG